MALLCGPVPTIWKSNSQHLHVHVQVLILADKWGCMPPIKVLEKSFDPIDVFCMCVLVCVAVPIIYIERYFNYSCRSLFLDAILFPPGFCVYHSVIPGMTEKLSKREGPCFVILYALLSKAPGMKYCPCQNQCQNLHPFQQGQNFRPKSKGHLRCWKVNICFSRKESSLIVGSDAQTRQGKAQQMRPKAGWRFTCPSSKHESWAMSRAWICGCIRIPGKWLWKYGDLCLALGWHWPVLDWPEAPRDWLLCTVAHYADFFLFYLPFCAENIGSRGKLNFWSLFCLKAWLHHLVVGVLAFLATVPQEPAELLPSSCAL